MEELGLGSLSGFLEVPIAMLHRWAVKQKTPAPESARAFCNARRLQVSASSLTRNEI